MTRWIQRLFKSTLFMSILMITPVTGVFASDMPDIPKQHAAEAELLISKGVIQGYKDGTFKPENSVSRLDAAIMIGRSLGLNGEPGETGFHDVPVDHRGSGYVAEMRERGIINGFNETTFAPYRPLSRGEMSLFLHRAFHDLATPYEPTAFFDLSSGMHAFQSIRYMTQSGISNGFPDGTFRPRDHVTRMQMSLFLARVLNDDFRVSPLPLPEQPRIASTKTAGETDQILTVVHNGNGRATVTYWKKDPYVWTKVRTTTNGFVGINGVSDTKREGDRNAPVGSFRMPFAFGTENPGTKMPFRPITNRSYWISNVNDPQYNTWQERSRSHAHDEHLIRYRDQYKYAMAIDYNMANPVPGKGSAIFLHVSNGTRPSAVCLSLNPRCVISCRNSAPIRASSSSRTKPIFTTINQ